MLPANWFLVAASNESFFSFSRSISCCRASAFNSKICTVNTAYIRTYISSPWRQSVTTGLTLRHHDVSQSRLGLLYVTMTSVSHDWANSTSPWRQSRLGLFFVTMKSVTTVTIKSVTSRLTLCHHKVSHILAYSPSPWRQSQLWLLFAYYMYTTLTHRNHVIIKLGLAFVSIVCHH